MIEAILGSTGSEKVLMFLLARDEGYAREIARFFGTDLAPIQKQLEKLENGGVLVSRSVGRTRVFSFNPRYPMAAELRALLEKTLQFYPDDVQKRLLMNRRRPRRPGKPL
ncbi:MAG TPA: winged helix-turn-helix domain-containing protein [Candidatus Krumholzibacteria bacterium]|nr:winged helix-turn-helix domain-containing protein [Candidatus Krumholzibacteria bacterium]